MHRISIRVKHTKRFYVVAHYVEGSAEPTATEREHVSRSDAWNDAFGRAGKLSAILGSPQTVEVDDGRIYRVSVERIKL